MGAQHRIPSGATRLLESHSFPEASSQVLPLVPRRRFVEVGLLVMLESGGGLKDRVATGCDGPKDGVQKADGETWASGPRWQSAPCL